ncbi:hypothetical protein BGY98DRAFT_947614 [Russula aff. rugulosa BPL654]|nr:hypothetical protein BGY98DRAFT_947614 [Russula aff. rugulosa BPL654]
MASAESLQPLLSTYTDEKADSKVDPLPSDQLPPSYQAASEAAAPPPSADSEPDKSRCCRRRGRCSRYIHFIIPVAVVALWLVTRYIVMHCQQRRFAHPHLDDDDDSPWGLHPPGHPPGRGGHGPLGDHIDTCVDSTDWVDFEPVEGFHPPGFETWQRAELSLPSSADDIFLFSPGFHSGGILHLVTVGSSKDSDLLKKMELCTLRRGKDGHGVGIFTKPFKRHAHDQDSLFFNITVSLPEGKDITTIPRFETRLPKYIHDIRALEKHRFGFISLHSFDSPIFVRSLAGDKINIRTRNGPIMGTFNTSSALEVKTSNSPIRVTSRSYQVKLHTSNSFLHAEVALLSTCGSQSNGSFFVSAHTSNSPLMGTFKLQTSIFTAHVTPDVDAKDPAGRGRKRVVNVKTVGHGSRVVYGDAEWIPQDEEAPAGRVEVSTSNSPLQLSL